MKKIDEVRKKKWDLEMEISKMQDELKALKMQEKNEIVEEFTDSLMAVQEEEGSLDERTLHIFLQDFASRIKDLYR